MKFSARVFHRNVNFFFIFAARCYAYHAYAVVLCLCLSVCSSVCLSFTFVHCVGMSKYRLFRVFLLCFCVFLILRAVVNVYSYLAVLLISIIQLNVCFFIMNKYRMMMMMTMMI